MYGSTILDNLLKMADKNSDDSSYRALGLIWLRLVQQKITNSAKGNHWKWLEVFGTTFNTVADTFSYTLATVAPSIDTTKTIAVYEKTNDISLHQLDYETFRRYVGDETVRTGTSKYFSVFGGKLLLYPIPSDAIEMTIDYVRVPTDPTDADTDIDIPDN